MAALRVGVALALGVGVAGLVARASDALWWQLLPWALLAAFWVVLLLRRRGDGPPGGPARPPERPIG
jgi:hypothetical protein